MTRHQKFLNLTLMTVLIVSFSSCGTSKAPNLNYTALAQASVKLNVKIDFEDNHDLYLEIAKWVGVPYRYGGNTKRGVDCSGFACSVYKTVYKKTLKRNSNEQMKQTSKVSRAKLQEGDLVFFSSSKSKKRASHVGIYLKDGKFIHSSSSGKGVMVSKLNEPYYKKYWIRGGRMN